VVEADGEIDAAVEVEVAEARWEWVVGPSLPAVVQENAVLTVGDDLWVLGGFQNLQLVDDVRVLKPGATSWDDGPTLPRTLHHMNAAVVAGQVFVLGSLQDFGFAAIGNAWRLDPQAAEPVWTASTPMPNARRRGSAGVAVVGDSVYIVGGFRGSAVAEVDVFDATRPDAADAWTALVDLPGERDHGAAAAFEGKVYYFGGRDTDISAVRADVWRYDPAAPGEGWVVCAPMPTARGGIAAAVYEGRVIVVGGEGNEAVGSGVFPDVEAYDPVTDTWERLPAMRTPRHGTSAAVVGGALWVPGGADVQAFGATDVVEYLVWRP
jgi:N-acetylneuraminic acid mutarotase